jgi:voltage-gated potassium channel
MLGLLLQTYRLVRAVVLLVRRPEGRALALLVVVQLVGGTVFYTLNEGWSWLDALYFSVTTLATVGLGDLAPATDAGKLFTVVFIFTGVGLLATFISMLAQQLRPVPERDRS